MNKFQTAVLLLFALSVSMSSQSASAADQDHPTHVKKVKHPVPLPKDMNYPWMTKTQFESQKKEAVKRGNRRLAAQTAVTEDLMSPAYRAFRDQLLALQTPEDLDNALQTLDQNYDTYPTDLKFLAAQIIPLRSLRSLVYRLVPLVETTGSFGRYNTRLAHSFLLTVVQQGVAFVRLYLPSPHARGGAFSYITEPVNSADTQFKSVWEFQDFLGNSDPAYYYGALVKAAQRISALNLTQPVVWDSQLVFGAGTLANNEDRFRLMGEPERHIALSALNAAMQGVCLFQAYDLDDLISMSQRVGELFGYDALLTSLDGVPAAERDTVYKDAAYKDTFTLRQNGQAVANLSLGYLRESVRQAALAWSELKDRTTDAWAMIDPASVIPWSRAVGTNLDTLEEMIEGPYMVHSAVTGKQVDVDLPGFIAHMPSDLRVLLPQTFQTGEQFLTVKFSNGTTTQYRDYTIGRPLSWSLNKPGYGYLFPQENSAANLADDVRSISETWGAGLAGLPVSLFFQ